jgi:hypothetical protein
MMISPRVTDICRPVFVFDFDLKEVSPRAAIHSALRGADAGLS